MKYLKLLTLITLSHNVFAVDQTIAITEHVDYKFISPILTWQNGILEKFERYTVPAQGVEYFLQYKVTTFTPRSGMSSGGNAIIRENNGQFVKDWHGDIFYFEISPFVGVPTKVAYVSTYDTIFKNGFD